MSITSKELETFIVNCQQDLELIKSSLSTFNIFNVLGVQHREIRHSNFLGWLFDPNETHQLGDVFLKELLKLLRKIDVLDSEQFINLTLHDLYSTRVYRESVNDIDILIVNEELGFVICIENKIYADYADKQLKKYFKYVKQNFKNFNKVFLTLTPGESYNHLNYSKGKKYVNINYQNIITLIITNKSLIDSALPPVKESINQYISMAKSDITNTSAEALLAQNIYKKYKKELNYIFAKQHDFAIYQKVLDDYFGFNLNSSFVRSHSSHANVVHILPKDESLINLFNYPEANSWAGGDQFFSIIIFLEKEEVILKWGFGYIEPSVKKETLQVIREQLFDKMKQFEVFNPKSNNEFSFLKSSDKKGDKHPKVGSVVLFNDEDLKNTDQSFMEFFKNRFEKLDEELIQPWIEECIANLGSVPKFTLNIVPTYFESGYINISKKASEFLGGHDSILKLEYNGFILDNLKIDRKSISSGAARLYGGNELKDFVIKNFKIGESKEVTILNQQHIRIL